MVIFGLADAAGAGTGAAGTLAPGAAPGGLAVGGAVDALGGGASLAVPLTGACCATCGGGACSCCHAYHRKNADEKKIA